MVNQNSDLLDLIDAHFTLSEIRQLCLDLSLDYEHLAGGSRPIKIINLIQYMDRRGRLPELIHRCRELRPQVDWPG